MKTRKRNRLMALALCLCMMVTMLPMTGMTFAAEPCPNHAVHDDTCGFAQAVEGHDCSHTHDDNCGAAVAQEGHPCKHEQGEHDGGCGYAPASEGTPCAHQEHDGDCGYAEAKEGATCQHVHDANCGYIAVVEGQPCGHTCELCDGSEAENALPIGEEPAATYSISGSVEPVDAYREGLSIEVTLWHDGQQVGSVMASGRRGNYSFTSLAPGTYTVKTGGSRAGNGIYYKEQSKTVVITDYDQECKFSLEPGNAPGTYSISGTVKSLDAYLESLSIEVTLWQDGQQVGGVMSDGRHFGDYSFFSLATGTYTVRVGGGRAGNGVYYTEQIRTVTLTDHDIEGCSFILAPGTAPDTYSISGIIALLHDGAKIPSFPVKLYQKDVEQPIQSATTNARGEYVFSSVVAGDYTVRAGGLINGRLYSEVSKPVSITDQNIININLFLAQAPAAPQNFQVTPGDKQVALSWKAPASAGSEKITKYEVSKDRGQSWTDASSVTGHTFLNLVNGKDYTFQVRAVNSVGAGEAASATAAPTAPGPSAPQNLYAQYGNQILYLHWKTPVSNGGSEIVKYQYSATADGTDDWKDIPDSGPDTVTYTVTGLTNGTTYTLKVRAVNSNGGVGEAASTTLAPQPVAPSAPRNLNATPGDGQMLLTWDPPENNGGSPITHYQYRYNVDPNSSGAMRYWTNMPDSGPDTVRFTVTGLENGKELVFWVRAVSDSGFSPHAMVTATPQAGATAPGVPQNFNANPGDQQVELSWTAPASNGGAAISGYQVSKDGGANWTNASSTTGYTFTGLTNGKSYTFQVRAVNSAGQGEAAEATATPQAQAAETFPLTVENGADVTASGPYAEGAKVNIKANAPADGRLFDKWISSGSGSFDDANSPETTFTMPAEAVTVTATYKNDTTAPTGTITVEDNGWSEFLNTITFGVFFKETQEVTISAQDDSGQDVTVAYHKADGALTLEQVQALAEGQWTAYSGAFNIAPNAKLVIYARLTDKAGNVTYISSDGIVLDNAAPTFSLTNGTTYDSAQTLTVSDSYLKSVTLDGAPQTLQNNACTVTLDTNGSYTIEATDKAGNTASITVTIDIPVVTAPNLTGITAPTAITGVANGTPLADISLPDKVAITTTQGDKQADVTWDRSTANPAYDPNSKAAQTFTISGTVTLPDGVTNTNGVSLTVTISVTVEAKETVSITGIEITSNPNKATYTEGEALDLTGLSVKLTFSDRSNRPVALADFAANNITATPENGTKLSMSNTTVTVSAGGKSDSFKITVNAIQQVQTPSFSLTGGAYEAAQEVEITCGTPGAKIHYTTDGNAPTATSPLYTGKIPVGSTTTIQAIAIKDGMKNSAIASATYTITTTPPHTHSYTGGWQSNSAGHWKVCSVCGLPGETTAHSGGTANCHTKAVCTVCGASYGALNPANHDGGTEIKDQKAATEDAEGYTGDTYCKGCGVLLEKGKAIPKLEPGHTHSFGGAWQSDATHHWQLCTAGNGEIGNKAAHSAGGWIDDKNLSENELSKRHKECTVCGYTMATEIKVKTDGIVEVKPGKDSIWKFYGAFKDLTAIRLNGVSMGIEPQSETSSNLTYPGYEGIAGITKAGSVEVTLYADFLKTLPAGTYTLEAEFASGKTTSTGSTDFTVSNDSKPEPKPEPTDPTNPTSPTDPTSKPGTTKPANPSDVPPTGDTRQLWPWALMMLAALAGCGSLLAYWRLSNKKRHR